MVVLLTATSVLHSQEATIAGMADDLAKSLTAGTHKRVAVVDFTDPNSTVTPLGKYFAQDLEVALAISQTKVDLVNRSRLNELMKENKLDATGLTDPETARKLGKIAGVEALIVGTVTPLDQTVKLDIEAIGTEDARVLAATSRNVLKTRDILALLGQAATPQPELFDSTGVTPQPTVSYRPTPKTMQVFESHDIQFALNACAQESSTLVCRLTIINKEDDRNLRIWVSNWCGSPSRLIDDSGREFKANSATLGSKKGECNVEGTLVMGIPTKTEIRFENIPSTVSSISLLELPSNVGDDNIDVKFHGVPLLRH